MATRTKFARFARYSREFVEASHIFLENGLWRVSASLASPRHTAWRMLASLASHNINTKPAENASASTPASTRDIRKICTCKICCRVAIACPNPHYQQVVQCFSTFLFLRNPFDRQKRLYYLLCRAVLPNLVTTGIFLPAMTFSNACLDFWMSKPTDQIICFSLKMVFLSNNQVLLPQKMPANIF